MDKPPRIEMRPAQPYAGTRKVMAMRDVDREIPAMRTVAARWLDDHGVRPSGKPFLRFHAIDMPERMDVEVGMPTGQAHDAGEEVESGLLPAGRYAVVVYTGVENGVPANRRLLDWIATQGEQALAHPSDRGEVFAARYETFLTDAEAEPDRHRWLFEVAIQVRG